MSRSTKYRDQNQDDQWIEGPCSILNCNVPWTHFLWITIRGHERWKRFCDKHYEEERQAEVEWKAGL